MLRKFEGCLRAATHVKVNVDPGAIASRSSWNFSINLVTASAQVAIALLQPVLKTLQPRGVAACVAHCLVQCCVGHISSAIRVV